MAAHIHWSVSVNVEYPDTPAHMIGNGQKLAVYGLVLIRERPGNLHFLAVLSSLYWLFRDCPARHEDFMTATGCHTPMLKFCKHRWVENVSVSERALLLWPHVKHYVEMVEIGELPNPKVKSFEEVKTRVADPLFTVKLGIFNSIAREINPFLTMSDQPMLPFLSDDMYKLIKGKDNYI